MILVSTCSAKLDETKGIQNFMVRGLVAKTVLLTGLILITYFTPNVEATRRDLVEGEYIDFDESHGSHFVESININGTMNFDGYNHSWSIVDLFDIDANDSPKLLLSGDYLDSIIPVEDGLWKWNLIVDFSSLNCTCNLIISSTSINDNQYFSNLLIYLGDKNHFPYIAPNSVTHEKIDQANNSITFTVINPSNNQNDAINSLNHDIILHSSFCQAPSNICLDNPTPISLNFTSNGEQLTVYIDQDELSIDDGYWLFDLSIQDQYLRNSNTITSRLVLDLNPPNVELTSKSTVYESESFLVYAYIDDYFIGSQMSLTWTITDPSGNSRGLLDEESYHNSTIELVLEQSGYWDIQLLVRDSANFIVVENISVLVYNVIPIVDLSIDGLFISHGDQIFISPGSSWTLNASTCFDSVNDIDSLEFEWYLDGVKLEHTGPILSETDINLGSSKEIMLTISDDDMDSESLSFTLSPNPSVDDGFSSKAIIYIGMGLAFLITFAVLIILLMRNSSSIELPKWNPKN